MMKFILTGGGTGGHLYPAIAIAEALEKTGACEIVFVGTKQGLEARVIPKLGYPLHTVRISGIHRGHVLKNVLFPFKMMVSFVQGLLMLKNREPDFIIGTGGYASWPILAAASMLKIPFGLQEQNQGPGLVTKVMASKADVIYLSFETSRQYFKNQDCLIMTGNPTRSSLNKRGNKEYDLFSLSPDKTTLFIFGGSQGAKGINQEIFRILDRLLTRPEIQILWSTGPRWFNEIQKQTEKFSDRVRIYPFIDDMGAAYSLTDLLVCRSGATTIAEVTSIGLPIVFIPFPGAAGNHQQTNAHALVEANAAEMVLESDFKDEKLIRIIWKLLDDATLRKQLAKRCKKFGFQDAAETIAQDIWHRTIEGI